MTVKYGAEDIEIAVALAKDVDCHHPDEAESVP
jgi:hypothetical protein